jgi:hypothetical protein
MRLDGVATFVAMLKIHRNSLRAVEKFILHGLETREILYCLLLTVKLIEPKPVDLLV